MWRSLIRRWRTVRTWLLVRIGFWRGRWQRGTATAPVTAFVPTFSIGRLLVGSWRFGVYCPAGLNDADSAPLIVLLHGCHQSAFRFAVATGWTGYADEARFRLLCPNQRLRANPLRCWNWFLLPAQRGAGEVAVMIDAIDNVSRRFAVDSSAVAAVGLSAGAALAALLAFHYPQRFVAAVAVAAPPILGPMNLQDPRDVMKHGLRIPAASAIALLGPCAPLAVIHGEDDDVVSPVCGMQLIEQAVASHGRQRVEAIPLPDSTDVIDYRVDGRLIARHLAFRDMRHEWTGGPGGEAYCEAGGRSLVAVSAQFLEAVRSIGRT